MKPLVLSFVVMKYVSFIVNLYFYFIKINIRNILSHNSIAININLWSADPDAKLQLLDYI